MSNILISFCNSKEPNSTNLYQYDLDSKEGIWIEHPVVNGITGFSNFDDKFIAIYQDTICGIFVFNKAFDLISHYETPEVSDPHSVITIDDQVHVVSTGTDSIENYRVTEEQISYLGRTWENINNCAPTNTDTLHLNAIYQYDGEIFLTGFGPKASELWSSAKDGFVMNISTGEKTLKGIYHPHSTQVDENKNVYYCESSTRSIYRNSTVIHTFPKGYTRGLSVDSETLSVGLSSGRKQSKSTGVVNNSADPGDLEQVCKVVIFDKVDMKKVHEIEFGKLEKEIYDIIMF